MLTDDFSDPAGKEFLNKDLKADVSKILGKLNLLWIISRSNDRRVEKKERDAEVREHIGKYIGKEKLSGKPITRTKDWDAPPASLLDCKLSNIAKVIEKYVSLTTDSTI